jgi:hypothetical protein
LSTKHAGLLFSVWLASCFVVQVCSAQARIDPSLPEAPLPKQREFHLFPGYETVDNPMTPVPALRPHQKFAMVYHKIVDRSYPAGAAISTTFEEVTGVGPRYDDGASGAAKLYVYNAANLASTFFFTDGLMPTLLHQDPRYFRRGTGSFQSRAWWALRSEGVTYSDDGRQVPNYSAVLGYGMSAALSDAYLPAQNVSFFKTMEGWGIKESIRFGTNLLREFVRR